ncbi:hypothetical protein P170DRAFT_432791 [Aspergillus steynii IBT 23096]|uniref:GATA transcription factor LreB n=1 Tax=Aspergillus steynii IBT 23096 TaxID=1392250 RepID=A0A2I2GQV3_9EURO|nr:uncharacterized protein P170DRAFT_432791 [Aspergillus steynii IBT 23096]PLB55260.1 hypothetical protein P170DRAFT_432791 [Aspergillus steynii IBT 23096]
MAHNNQLSLVQGHMKDPYTTAPTAATTSTAATATTAAIITSPTTTLPIMASTAVSASTAAAREPRYLPPSHTEKFGAQNVDSDPSSDATKSVWTQRVLGEMKDMLLLLGSDGRIAYASPACHWITGYEFPQIDRHDIARFIHTEDRAFFAAEMDECIANSRPFHCHFRFYKRDNASCVLEAYGHPHMATPKRGSGSSNGRPTQVCNGVFLVCRPYPTRSSQTLDSFLEHKLENIRLNQRIAQLREEEEEDDINAGQQSAPGNQTTTTTTTHTMHSTFITSVQSSVTQSNVAEAAGSGDDSNDSSDEPTIGDESDSRSLLEQVEDRLPQTEDMSHIEGIEVMTGLYYGDGERSQGLSTGLRQGRLIHCNRESSSPESQEQDLPDSDRRKRLKGEYMCTDCGTADSPEWRKGPEGPKTLCNACGLRWAKKEKKRQDPI